MKLLFDENLPFSLSSLLAGCQCSSVQNEGWAGTKNGQLLTRAEASAFQVLLTLDRNMKSEQNMTGRRISIIVLVPASQRKEDVHDLAPQVLELLESIEPGDIRTVSVTP